MKKIKEIREIKHDVKVKEIKKEGDADGDLEGLTSTEVPVSQNELESFSHSSRQPEILGRDSAVGDSRPVFFSGGLNRQSGGEESGNRLYDSNRDGEGDEKKYNLADSQGPTLSQRHAGQDFSMGSSRGNLPENTINQGGAGSDRGYVSNIESKKKKDDGGYTYDT